MISKPIERPTEETANFIHDNIPFHLERRGAAGGTIVAVTSVYGIVTRSETVPFWNGLGTVAIRIQGRNANTVVIGRHQNLNVLH